MGVNTIDVAKEGGTYVVTVNFYDEDGTAITPTSASWTLKDSGGTVVNGKENEPITGLDTVNYIVLTGADLPVNGHLLEELTITITSIYNSVLGNGLTGIGQAKIPVEAV